MESPNWIDWKGSDEELEESSSSSSSDCSVYEPSEGLEEEMEESSSNCSVHEPSEGIEEEMEESSSNCSVYEPSEGLEEEMEESSSNCSVHEPSEGLEEEMEGSFQSEVEKSKESEEEKNLSGEELEFCVQELEELKKGKSVPAADGMDSEIQEASIKIADSMPFTECDDSLISIMPTIDCGVINMDLKLFGPFVTGMPTKVPFWVAFRLGADHKCRISHKNWDDLKFLRRIITQEFLMTNMIRIGPSFYSDIEAYFKIVYHNNSEVLKPLMTEITNIKSLRLNKIAEYVVKRCLQKKEEFIWPVNALVEEVNIVMGLVGAKYDSSNNKVTVLYRAVKIQDGKHYYLKEDSAIHDEILGWLPRTHYLVWSKPGERVEHAGWPENNN